MVRRVESPSTIEHLVERMFDQVFSPAERAELLVWIHRWEADNPNVDTANRVTGWIDVAYAFQQRRNRDVPEIPPDVRGMKSTSMSADAAL